MARIVVFLLLQCSKTEILPVGPPLDINFSRFKLKWEKERIYSLGTWFYKDQLQGITYTFLHLLKVLKSMVNSWSKRKLSWIGKITVIKTLILSKINYAISSLETPAWFITEVETIVYNFLWSNKPAHVKINVMTNDYNNGGLRMTDINLYIKSQKMSWIKRLLENDCTVPCKFVSHFIDMKLNNFLKCNIADDEH